MYEVPTAPFNWFDRPPSVNRMIGIKWLANLLYPNVFRYDMAAEVKDFYAKFYHYNLGRGGNSLAGTGFKQGILIGLAIGLA